MPNEIAQHSRVDIHAIVLFFVGAVAAHLRARVFHNIAFPTATLVLTAAH
jgi:hypothetical protein